MTAVVEPIQFRCRGKLHGIKKTLADGTEVFEIRCKEKWCADRKNGEVVLHYFDFKSGKLVKTTRFRDPVVSGYKER